MGFFTELDTFNLANDALFGLTFVLPSLLQERNEKLFYKLLIENVEELLPVVYTPIVGEACQKYGGIFRCPQGFYISFKESMRGKILECLPITIDVGTNNEQLLKDENNKKPSQTKPNSCFSSVLEYSELLHEFMRAVKQNYGEKVLIQFEDFANHNAFEFLAKYGTTHLVFNDDIQWTSSVVLAGVVAALKLVGGTITKHTFLFFVVGELVYA
ncbi:hypothetical protein KFK09_009591 [Dendrobium nobile]|uniref:Malic enzyme N-terminal domain-containing protein n=1 Tax=Dendrobium nobile TaxID=94219 RepID=A0A8T3BN67_DENNO|nr:hypothetical protein KFK09_009591 [Dendrobium nobile]